MSKKQRNKQEDERSDTGETVSDMKVNGITASLSNDTITDSLGKHLDNLRTLINWIVAFSFVTVISAWSGKEQIQILGATVNRLAAGTSVG